MATSEPTTGTRDEQYNLISMLYHALQGADTCATYLQDAERAGDQELVQFFREVQSTNMAKTSFTSVGSSADSRRRIV